MGSTDRIEAVAELIVRSVQAGHKVVAVVSAMAGETNRLLGLAQQIDPRASSRELDVLAATGEQVTIALLAMALIKRGYPAVSLLADQISVNTDNKFGKARILSVDKARLAAELEQGHIVVAAGFQGRDVEGNVTTLGRGGSDTSAVAIAAAINADECQIFTDVDGVYSIDPRICSGARRLPYIPFNDMLELASLGAKVLHSRSVEYAGRFKVPLRVLSTFRPDAGTLMVYEDIPMQMPIISGIACQSGVTFVQCSNLTANSLTLLMQSLARLNVEADMVQQQDLAKNNLLNLERSQQNLAKLSVIGSGIKSQPELVARIFTVLEQMNIQIWLVTQAETRFSVLMPPELMESVAARLHQTLVSVEN